MKLSETILNLLFPPKCPFCGKVLNSVGICPQCEKDLPWLEDERRLQKFSDSLVCAVPLRYEGNVRQAVLRLKFRGAEHLALPLGEVIARCAAESYPDGFDVVTWAPVSRRRRRKRGYDQSYLLAEAACRLWDTKPERLLEKVQDTPPQSELSEPAARRANVLGVYDPAQPETIRGKRVLLVDDVCTTGATLTECVRVLKDAGAAEVLCVVLAAAIREDEKKEKNGCNR